MKRDITYCSGLRCDQKQTCERWTENLRRSLDKSPWSDGLFSIAQFADHAGNCSMYISLEVPKPKSETCLHLDGFDGGVCVDCGASFTWSEADFLRRTSEKRIKEANEEEDEKWKYRSTNKSNA